MRALLLAAWAGAGAGAGVVDIIKCERAGRGRSLVQAAAGRVFVLRPTSPLHTHTLHAARAAFMTLDLCEAEQSALAREHVLTARLYTDDPHSHAGPRSISPFAPCCASRLPVVYDAARLTRDSVVWDLGCGDGRVLHDAAARYGCRCVGVEIDATCLRRCASRAKSRGPVVENLCRWHLADVTAAPEGVLGRDDALAPPLEACAANGGDKPCHRDCPVCQEEFEIGEKCKKLPCQHVFHPGCILPWLKVHNTCPVCRHELPVEEDVD